MPPTYQDVEQVIRSVSGVASASIGAVGGTGRGRLRIRLEAGHDPDAVSHAVAATLRERFGIDVDPAAIRPRPAEDVDVDAPLEDDQPEAPAPTAAAPSTNGTATTATNGSTRATATPVEPAAPVTEAEVPAARATAPEPAPDPEPAAESSATDEVPEHAEPMASAADVAEPSARPLTVPEAAGSVVGFARPMIQGLSVGADGLEVHVQAVLTADGRELRGKATGAATRKATLRAVARATLDAVEQLFPGRVKTELESLELSHDGEDEVCTASVTFLTNEGAEKLIGISIVRGDAEHAVMRSTLDAVNRRIGLMIEESVAS